MKGPRQGVRQGALGEGHGLRACGEGLGQRGGALEDLRREEGAHALQGGRHLLQEAHHGGVPRLVDGRDAVGVGGPQQGGGCSRGQGLARKLHLSV